MDILIESGDLHPSRPLACLVSDSTSSSRLMSVGRRPETVNTPYHCQASVSWKEYNILLRFLISIFYIRDSVSLRLSDTSCYYSTWAPMSSVSPQFSWEPISFWRLQPLRFFCPQ
ncbi:hypothetical protein FA13DRAFT_1740140 [Coprinellus micaceus]|uniref:Uncharacterized protein n=1 Tax=Coprinellus micaceus TaxID=71717 RepID=A0A4Y7SNU8_COPMI|nr:hypothetical protein FA13DRAFT_1740140 [Coprinellus micaceus]